MRVPSIVAGLMLVSSGICQVRPVYSSLESYVAGAQAICVGKISKIEDVKLAEWEPMELTIEVSQTLKGKVPARAVAHRDRQARSAYESARKAGVEYVWFFPKDTARNEICLELAHSEYKGLGGLAIGMDYTILGSGKDVVNRIKRFLRESPGASASRGAALLSPLPGQSLTGIVDFLIPLCPWAEKLAVRMITKPESFEFGPPVGNPYDPSQEPIWRKSKAGLLRTEGLIVLQHFRSASNIRLAKRYLNDDSVAMRQVYGKPQIAYYWVRDAAFHLLEKWDVKVERPGVEGPPVDYLEGHFGCIRDFEWSFRKP